MRLSFLGLILVLFLSSSCTPRTAANSQMVGSGARRLRCPEGAVDSSEVSRIAIEYGRELEEEHRLFLYNSWITFDGDIKKVRIDFTSQASIELCEAREVLFDVVEGYLNRLQGNAIVRNYFRDSPITAKDIDIHITYQSFFNKYADPGYISYIILEDGWSYFYTAELDEAYTDIWMQKVEPYSKTRQFVTFRREAEEPFIDKKKQPRKTALSEERFFIDS
ncbi:MAG: hypothetical protein VX777_01100 [Chlamydiota bacterium]|nr:hypothetical protein [Chlamydiota bacterium]